MRSIILHYAGVKVCPHNAARIRGSVKCLHYQSAIILVQKSSLSLPPPSHPPQRLKSPSPVQYPSQSPPPSQGTQALADAICLPEPDRTIASDVAEAGNVVKASNSVQVGDSDVVEAGDVVEAMWWRQAML